MLRRCPVFGLAMSLALSAPAFAQDSEFCERLKAFETAPLAETGEQQARWIEMHWRGSWLNFETGWGVSCLSSVDEAARQFCEWLPSNVSYEFADLFPRRILACKGYSVPPIQGWKGEVELWDSDDRSHYMMINFASLEEETGAVRFVSVGDGATDPEIENRPLEAMPPLKND